MRRSFVTIIMAGGQGKRMKSDLPKVLHRLNDRPLAYFVIDLAREVGSERILLVIGYKREMVREATLNMDVEWVVQEEQLGTGDAIKSCREALKGYKGDLLILSGDVPLLRPATIDSAFELHKKSSAAVTVFTFKPDNPTGYGRIIRGTKDELLRIVEEKDASDNERRIDEVNAGIYFFKSELLFPTLEEITNDNASGEYYLPDTVSLLGKRREPLAAFLVKDPVEVAGVNTAEQLLRLERELSERKS